MSDTILIGDAAKQQEVSRSEAARNSIRHQGAVRPSGQRVGGCKSCGRG